MQSSSTTSFLVIGLLALIVGVVIGYLYASGVGYQKGYDQGLTEGRSAAPAASAAPSAASAGNAGAAGNPFAPPAAANPFQRVKLNPFAQ